MKKLIALVLPLSFALFACTSPSETTSEPSQATQETEEIAAANGEKVATVVLISPEGEIPMGDVEMILEVKDSTSGEMIPVETLEVSSTMPMEGEESMISKVEIEPTETPGQFKVKTNFSMAGTWNLAANIKDANYQGGNEITVEVK
jgi:hypothetical protein